MESEMRDDEKHPKFLRKQDYYKNILFPRIIEIFTDSYFALASLQNFDSFMRFVKATLGGEDTICMCRYSCEMRASVVFVAFGGERGQKHE